MTADLPPVGELVQRPVADEDCEHLGTNVVQFNDAQQRREYVCTDCGRVHLWMTREMLEGFLGAETLWRERAQVAAALVFREHTRRVLARRGVPLD